jgi:hypothetical protein
MKIPMLTLNCHETPLVHVLNCLFWRLTPTFLFKPFPPTHSHSIFKMSSSKWIQMLRNNQGMSNWVGLVLEIDSN